ncbi:MAG: YicC/YloC family endoribonuclease [Thermoguttaceae bacterium]
MLVSMTGFAAVRETVNDDNGLSVSVEVRSVNHRHFKLSLRVYGGDASLESRIEPIVRELVERGAVSMQVRVTSRRATVSKRLNTPLLESLFMELIDFKNRLSLMSPTTLESLLVFPDLLIDAAPDDFKPDDSAKDCEWAAVEQTVREAVRQMQQMRCTEGAAMASALLDEVGRLETAIVDVAERAPQVPRLYQQRLTERLAALIDAPVPTEVAREVALFADRCDITEEIVRFQSHCEQFHTIINEDKAAGRKLDFLLQEMFREVNTLGAKANDIAITRHVVDMKNGLEKMREIVQNVE